MEPKQPSALLDLLSNSLVLYQTAPYLPLSSLLALGAASKELKNLIHNTRGVFRYLDLTQIKSARFQIPAIDHGGEVWRNQQLDENVTEDDFYGGPLRGIFNTLRKWHLLQDVQTLILDGLSVTSDFVCEIILEETYNVRILSIREVQNLNERKLQQALRYAIRPSRPANTPKLQGMYIFGKKDSDPPSFQEIQEERLPARKETDALPYSQFVSPQGVDDSGNWAQKLGQIPRDHTDKWYQGGEKIISKPPSLEWAHTMKLCEGIVSFDAVLCSGPRHSEFSAIVEDGSTPRWYEQLNAKLGPRVATHSLASCQGCGKAPEGELNFGVSPISKFPLLAPPPLRSSSSAIAKTPFASKTTKFTLLARCLDCLQDRFCENCHVWWCENCYKSSQSTKEQMEYRQPWEASSEDREFGNGKNATSSNTHVSVQESCFKCGQIVGGLGVSTALKRLK